MGQSAQLQIGGRNYQVVSSASQEELDRLATRVEQALTQVGAAGSLRADRGLLLAALRLAHEAETAEAERQAEKNHYKQQLGHYLNQLNEILGRKPSADRHRRVPPRKFEVHSIHVEPTSKSDQRVKAQELEQSLPVVGSTHAAQTTNPWGEEAEKFASRLTRGPKDNPRQKNDG
jgi:cell division protein ZapA (FtsZ GTPase activity inhibitor)